MITNYARLLQQYPAGIIEALAALIRERQAPCYIAGGTIRDWLLRCRSSDLDITVSREAFGWAEALAGKLGGSFVPLDEAEDVARVVWQGCCIDFSSFREGAATIEEDLRKRDFTINSMAIPFFDPETASDDRGKIPEILDPAGGEKDLESKVIRANSGSVFVSDPLRLLRAFRFMAVFGFAIEPVTQNQIRKLSQLLHFVAEERLRYELDRIMAAAVSYPAVRSMHENEVLQQLLPELYRGVGVEQPTSHHLDVFDHSLAAFKQMEAVLAEPANYFPDSGDLLAGYLEPARRKILLKWAALFHDLGKPKTSEIREDRNGRITFYNHDKVGASIFEIIAERFKWSRDDRRFVSLLIAVHMWPFHLNNARKKTGLTAKAYMRLIKAVGEDFHGLFLLAMADSLAGKGSGKPPGMEEEVADLYYETAGIYSGIIRPVLEKRLLNGRDLVEAFGLEPGPLFGRIFTGLENARVDGAVLDRDQALAWVKNYLKLHN